MKSKIWLSSPHMGGTEQKYVKEAFDTNWIAPLGPNVTAFEQSLMEYCGSEKQIAALSSGTSAIHLALILLGVSHGDEVLCQSFTFSASANPILYQGAIPVFVDSEIDTWNMCPVQLEIAILDRLKKGKTPKAIIVVASYGMPYKYSEIKAVSQKYNIPVIEDAASALGSKINKQKCGTFGDFGIISFNGNKIITTSGGGALICNSIKTKEKAVFLATQARDQAPHYEHSHIGYNYRMSNILAGIGRGQMEVLEKRVATKRKIHEIYKNELKKTGLQFLSEPEGFYSNRWLTCILTQSFEIREKIRLSLETENIESRPLWKPLHMQPIFQHQPKYENGVSAHLFERGLCLPSGSNNSENDIQRVINVLKEF